MSAVEIFLLPLTVLVAATPVIVFRWSRRETNPALRVFHLGVAVVFAVAYFAAAILALTGRTCEARDVVRRRRLAASR